MFFPTKSRFSSFCFTRLSILVITIWISTNPHGLIDLNYLNLIFSAAFFTNRLHLCGGIRLDSQIGVEPTQGQGLELPMYVTDYFMSLHFIFFN